MNGWGYITWTTYLDTAKEIIEFWHEEASELFQNATVAYVENMADRMPRGLAWVALRLRKVDVTAPFLYLIAGPPPLLASLTVGKSKCLVQLQRFL